MLDDHHIRQCAWLVGEDINRRRIAAIPVPTALTDLHRALADEVSAQRLRHSWQRDLSASGHETTEIGQTTAELESTAEVARRLGVSERTARRHAPQHGAQRIGNRWVFPREETR